MSEPKDTELKPITAVRIKADARRAFEYKRNWITEAHEDYRFALGKQWDDADVAELRSKGVLALTINKIKPNVKLLTGIESQNRADIICYPENRESGIKADIATGLVKNVFKTSGLNWKRSEQFKHGIISGECYVEPYVDYTEDMINGDMKFKRCAFNTVFPEPGFEEYDMSDARYCVKVTFNQTREQILSLFPNSGKYLDSVGTNGLLTEAGMTTLKSEIGIDIQKRGYNDSNVGGNTNSPLGTEAAQEPLYDLVEYYFKKWTSKYYVVKFTYGADGKVQSAQMKEAASKTEADTFVADANIGTAAGQEAAKMITRVVPEIWRASMIGESTELIEEEMIAPTYPKWKSYPFIPYFADRITLPMKDADTHLLVQGIVRDMKSLNMEYNKRRTQELRILNSSANSGFVVEENALVEEAKWEKYGSTPGVVLKVKQGKMGAWQKMEPTQLSQGHSQLAAEGGQDMKESSGINTDLLALEEGGSDSGRAIALRQKQGMVMVQGIFDNLSQTTRLYGKFILSHLGDVYDVGEAIHVMGEGFIKDNFSVPVLVEQPNPVTQQLEKVPQLGPDGQLVMQVDQQAVVQVFNEVLSDTTLGKYDVAVGEAISSETVKYANYMVLMDMAKQGLPIPPDVLVDESLLTSASKEKIKKAIEQQQAAAVAQPAKSPKKAA